MIKFTIPFPAIWHRFLAMMLTATFSVIALNSCSLKNFETEAAQVPQLVQHIVGEPKTFNYPLSQESPNVFDLTYEGMLTSNGLTGELEPALAETWDIAEDNKRIVFTLREGLKWSDGAPLTADDVIFSYNDIYFNEEIPTDVRDIFRIGENRALPTVRKLDDRRVEFTVPEPFAPFLRFAGGVAILPKHALEKAVKTKDQEGKPIFLTTWGTDTDPRSVIVNGPYMLENYTTSERVVFRRNPHYWRNDVQGNAQPYIDRLIWQIVENTDTALLQFRSGGLDTLEISPASFSLLKREEDRGNFTIHNGGPATGTSFITFNLNQGRRNGKPLVDPVKSRWFNTVAFRQAIAYGIDRQTMINNIFRGLGATQNSPISVQSPYYLPPEKGLNVYSYDPEKAKELLKGAGFKYNAQGQLLDADSNRVRFTLLSNAGGRVAPMITAQIKRDLSKIGIQVDLQLIAFNVLVDKLSNTLDWDCYYGGFTGGVEPNSGANIWLPDGGLHVFNQKPLPGQEPLEGRVVADWEQRIGNLYIQGAQELDEAKRKEIYAETQRLNQEYLPFIHLINPLALAAIRNRIQNVKYSALGGSLWNVHELKAVEQ